jgi:hypothetical protein
MGRLRDALLREAEEDNRQAVSEIVSKSADDKYDLNSGHSGGFAAACQESNSALCRKLECQLIADVKDGQSEAENSRRALYRKYVSALGRSRMDSLIVEHRPR